MEKIYLEAGSINCLCCPEIPTCRNVPDVCVDDHDPVAEYKRTLLAELEGLRTLGGSEWGDGANHMIERVKQLLGVDNGN